ncbi:MAG: hypothetical protein RL589_50 [Actinomycetota bacterium]|jgi:sialic acid synthase SpsE
MTVQDPYIIAEVAWGHNGNVDEFKQIVDLADANGASALSVHVTDLPSYMVPSYGVTKEAVSVELNNESVFNYLERINIQGEELEKLCAYIKSKSLDLIVMPNDVKSLELAIQKLHPDALVLPAAAFVDSLLVSAMSKTSLPVFLRIGGATTSEIQNVIHVLRMHVDRKIVLLHGHQNYPTKIEDLRFDWINQLKVFSEVEIGLADHVSGDDPFALITGSLALALGVRYIEKHLVLDFQQRGEDFEAALDKTTFPLFMDFIFKTGKALNSNSKITDELPPDVVRYRNISRKKIVSSKSISKGEKFTLENIAFMRASVGVECSEINTLLEKVARNSYEQFESIESDEWQ